MQFLCFTVLWTCTSSTTQFSQCLKATANKNLVCPQLKDLVIVFSGVSHLLLDGENQLYQVLQHCSGLNEQFCAVKT